MITTPDTWELRLRPVAPVFAAVGDAYLILTIKNIGKESKALVLPYLENHQWFQWIEVRKDGQKLPPGVDEDYVYPPGTVQPGEQLSMLVGVGKFYDDPTIGTGAGSYVLSWSGGTIGFAKSVSAGFEVRPGAVESPQSFTLEFYFGPSADLPLADKISQLWMNVLKSPSDPKWLALLRFVPQEHIDVEALIKLAEITNDVGIRREAVRVLARVGKRQELVSRVTELLRGHEDKPLHELGLVTIATLRGNSAD